MKGEKERNGKGAEREGGLGQREGEEKEEERDYVRQE